ncbi:MAG: Nif11-like leader peptide family natural product precursor [Synechococcus sp. YX04-3]|jgi:predicted ribosomally synthesized peptide with nif11-like leader|nr:nif11-like leader peptide domain protein [Synechococcus sp. RS9915]QNI91152.1 nif11-like leader peptide domain protein [Synechococcus sp. BOUM118]RNC88971.1 MAG: Nif11-like leader peptide family natural product precursor [Synechococcus sp. YX04-3]|tara:strand:+ start:232 stop:477 length:246 start_codon:yes stop_codon:yes gene_type:complete
MSLSQLDQFLSLRESNPLLAQRLASPLELEDFLQLAREWGFQLTESDVLAAQKRAMDQGSAAALQRAQAEESRRLRNFIHG